MRKSEQICARITPGEMAILRALADRHCLLLSEFIRQVLAERVSELTTAEANSGGLVMHCHPDVPFRYRYR